MQVQKNRDIRVHRLRSKGLITKEHNGIIRVKTEEAVWAIGIRINCMVSGSIVFFTYPNPRISKSEYWSGSRRPINYRSNRIRSYLAIFLVIYKICCLIGSKIIYFLLVNMNHFLQFLPDPDPGGQLITETSNPDPEHWQRGKKLWQ